MYRVQMTGGAEWYLDVDLTQADGPLAAHYGDLSDVMYADDKGWRTTPYRVADAGHDARRAAELTWRYHYPDAAESADQVAGVEPVACECWACPTHDDDPTHYDAGPLCGLCADWTTDRDSGEVVCARATGGWQRCHVCRSEIDWGRIQHGDPGSGSPALIVGSCDCGDAWTETERGNWGHYEYDASAAEVV